MTRSSETLTPPLSLQQGEGVPPIPSPRARGEGQGEGLTSIAFHSRSRVCTLEDIPRLGARVVKRVGEPDVAIFRTADDRLFALADRCPHRGGPLSQGIVFGDRVACPLHSTCIDLDSGCAVAPDKGYVSRYSVKVDGGAVFVDLEVHAGANG